MHETPPTRYTPCMSPSFFRSRSHHTEFVTLNSHVCQACWHCVEACPSKVLGKVNLPWHKHAVIHTEAHCTGCFICIKACAAGALMKRTT
jgi:Fe-S-cluster-containing hydrogenase component 2